MGVSLTAAWEPSAVQFATAQSIGIHVCERSVAAGKLLPSTNEHLFFSVYFDNADRNETLHKSLASRNLAPTVECVERVNWANGCPLRAVLSKVNADALDARQYLGVLVSRESTSTITDTLDALFVFLYTLAEQFVLSRASLYSLIISGNSAERIALLDTSALVYVAASSDDEESRSWAALASHAALLEALVHEVPSSARAIVGKALAQCVSIHPLLLNDITRVASDDGGVFDHIERTLLPQLQISVLAFARHTLIDLDPGYNRGVSRNLLDALAPDVDNMGIKLCERTALAVLVESLSATCKSTCLDDGRAVIESLYRGGEFVRFSSLWQLSTQETLRVMIGELASGLPNIVEAMQVESEHPDLFARQLSSVCENTDVDPASPYVCVRVEQLESFQQQLSSSSYTSSLVTAFGDSWKRLCSFVTSDSGVFCFFSAKVSWDQVFVAADGKVKFVDLIAGRNDCSLNARSTLLKAAAMLTRDLLYLAMVDVDTRSALFDQLKAGIDGIASVISWNAVMYEVSNLRLFGRFSIFITDEWDQGSYTLHPEAGDQSIAALTNEFARALRAAGNRLDVEEKRWRKSIEKEQERFIQAHSDYKVKRLECKRSGRELRTRRARNYKEMLTYSDNYGIGSAQCE